VGKLDRSGKDFDIIVDNKQKTITVSAVYYSTRSDATALNLAVSPLNSMSGIDVSYKDDSYKVGFDLRVVTVDSPDLELASSRTQENAEGDLMDSDVTNTNTFELVTGNSPKMPKDAAGVTIDGKKIQVRSEYASHAGVGTHEVLHTLGVGHRMAGIMTESIKDGRWSEKVHEGIVGDIVNQTDAGSGVGVGTVREVKK
jgi:hypothetical protein